ncbi:hypothetical protein CEXT_810101 [Caerostris extrusa]|uniref:Uncharacterized protein n=1 Tax=Caerostris extrusa TaxID=172846 RepID=A0AAV4U1F3_CAEEX|nr:hypothetical protein CEXT_810101 [Caerostris extrusa]
MECIKFSNISLTPDDPVAERAMPQNIEERLSAEMDTSFSVDSDETTQAADLRRHRTAARDISTSIDTTKAIRDIQFCFQLMYIIRK